MFECNASFLFVCYLFCIILFAVCLCFCFRFPPAAIELCVLFVWVCLFLMKRNIVSFILNFIFFLCVSVLFSVLQLL